MTLCIVTLQPNGQGEAKWNLADFASGLPIKGEVRLTAKIKEAPETTQAFAIEDGIVAGLVAEREQARKDSARKAEEAERIARQDSIARAVQARQDSVKQAEETRRQRFEAERAAEEQRRVEAEQNRVRSRSEAIGEWKRFRTNEESSMGTVTTWRMKVTYSLKEDLGVWGSCWYCYSHLGDYGDYPVRVRCDAWTVHDDDWIVVTGKFVSVSSSGEVELDPIRITVEGYKE